MRRPWNLSNLPVYSLATYGEKLNMNICTYVSAVSMKPKRYMVAVYHHTQTLQNITHGKRAVLQVLAKSHVSLVHVLGKKSGLRYDKESYLNKKGALVNWRGKKVLVNCAAQLEIEKIWSRDAGDHTMFLFDVTRFVTHHEDVLMLDDLREKKLVRM